MKNHRLLSLMAIALAVIVPALLDNEFYLKIIFTAGMYYIAAAGLNVLVGWSGQKSLGHAGLFAAGAYTAALLTAQAGWNAWLALIASAIVAALFGLLIAFPSLRVKGPSLAMVTIGFGIVVEKIVTEWQEPFGGQAGIYGVLPPTIGGQMLGIREWAWLMLAFSFLTHYLISNLLQGKYGRAMMAVQASEVAAESVGVNVYRFKVLAFVISAVTCGLAGAFMAQQNQYINSDFINFRLSIFLLLIVLFGGPSIWGPVLGAIALTLLDAFLARWPELQHFTYGALLLFALYAMPQGLAGALQKVMSKFGMGQSIPNIELPKDAWKCKYSLERNPDAVILEAKGLFKAYGGVIPTNDVSLTLRPGHIHSLIGPNGAGKTTLLNILSGIVKPDRGTVDLFGNDVTKLAANEVCSLGIGRTFQNLRLFSHMSVLENVLVGLHPHLVSGLSASMFRTLGSRSEEAAARSEAMSLLRLVGLQERAHVPAGSLPYGLQRRLEIARALATHPKLLLLDEPAAGLNPQETQELTELIRQISDLGITVMLIEHHMDLVMAVSDHVVVLDHGEKIAEGAPKMVQSNPAVIKAYLGDEEEEA
jgi:branched-chain amino acid transport system permease protein